LNKGSFFTLNYTELPQPHMTQIIDWFYLENPQRSYPCGITILLKFIKHLFLLADRMICWFKAGNFSIWSMSLFPTTPNPWTFAILRLKVFQKKNEWHFF
jgi:hypothetical protein